MMVPVARPARRKRRAYTSSSPVHRAAEAVFFSLVYQAFGGVGPSLQGGPVVAP
jgi:hypothetical protein